MCPCDLSIPHKQYQENCQNHAAWVMLVFLAHFFLILLGMSLICKTANNSSSSGCCWWIVTTTYWRLTLTVGQKLVYPFGTYVISTPPRRIHRGKEGKHAAHCLPFLLGRYHWQSSVAMCQLCCCCLRQVFLLQAMLASNPWWSFCLSFSEHHILLMQWMALWESSDPGPSFHARSGACWPVISWMWTQMNPIHHSLPTWQCRQRYIQPIETMLQILNNERSPN